MQIRSKIAAAAVAVVALGGAGATAAAAASHAPAQAHPAASGPTGGPDIDNLQVGDQTSPDTPAAKAASASHVGADGSGDQENAGENSENGPSDGPGGHADPSGDVQHEFDGVE